MADVSCDIDGPVACTLRPSTIADPLYGYHPQQESECAMNDPEGITVMAVDNLPCELPRDASHGFGKDMMAHVIPLLVGGDRDNMLTNATETTLEGIWPQIQVPPRLHRPGLKRLSWGHCATNR